MRPRSPLRVAIVVAVAIVVVAAAGYLVLADETPRPSPERVENASERVRSLDSMSATVSINVTRGSETTRLVERVESRPGTGEYRIEVLEGNVSADVRVSNGTATWYYDRENETVRRQFRPGNTTETQIVMSGDRVERLLKAAVGEGNDSDSTVTVLPTVSTESGASSGAFPRNGSALRLNASYAGVEHVLGHETYAIDLTQHGEAGRVSNYTSRIWIDTDWLVPVKQRLSYATGNRSVTGLIEFRNATFNAETPDRRFRFDPPADANVTTSTMVRQYDTQAALERNATLSIPDPDLPAGLHYREGAFAVGENRSISIRYQSRSASLILTVSTATGTPLKGTEVQVGDATGYLDRTGPNAALTWECGGRRYQVVSAYLTNETVVDIGRSIDCQ